MPADDFCHLHVHTEYSLLDGACRISEMAEKAAELGMPAVACTDHGNMHGIVRFHDTMRAHGIKPIIGFEGYFTPGDRTDREHKGRPPELFHLTLLAQNEQGYRNLVEMTSFSYLDGLYYKPRIDWELLGRCSEGVICLSGCLASRFNQLVLQDRHQEGEQWLSRMAELFGPDRFYVEIQDHGLADQKKVRGATIEAAERLGLPLVATNDCHYLNHGDDRWHEVLLCISTRSTLDDPNRFKMSTDQLYFKTQQEMAELFADVPGALDNTVKIAEMCDVQLDTSRKYPAFRKEGVDPQETPRHLRQLAEGGLRECYGEISDQMQERLDYELEVIEQMGYVDYFLITGDFVRYAREQGIPVGLRGSAAGSLVNHALGITDINPMDYDLIFNRFLDPERREAPDIDIDLCEERREEVIDYVRQRYGEDKVAQIVTFGTLQARNCIRDVGRVLDVPLSKVDRVAKMVPFGMGLDEALETMSDLKAMAQSDEEVGRIISYARKLEGFPRHTGKHAAGVVITDQPLWELAPVYKTSDGSVMIQWEMDDMAQMGLLKMDFLGLRTLTIVNKTGQIIRDNGKDAPDLSIKSLDLEDPATYRLIGEGLTRGVFQLGTSPGMRRMLMRLQPSSIEDLIAAVAIYRPGPLQSGMVDDFIDRRHGRADIEYPHPAFEPILKPTYGVILYQEQIMRIANTIAGMSMGNALTMIKAISKKREEKILKYREDFIRGAIDNDLDEGTATEIFELILHFAGYGFNKAHSAAYAFVAFITAYLKAHYPQEFMAASISCEMGDTDKVVALMEECDALGIEVLPPDVNESREEFTPIGGSRLRFGLGAVKGVGSKAVQAVLEARDDGGPFRSLFDFCERVDPHQLTRGVLEALLKAGCFDNLPGHRAQQLALVETALKVGARAHKNRAQGQAVLFGGAREEDPEKRMAANVPDVPEPSPRELARQEAEALGLYVRYDPLVEHRRTLDRFSTAYADEIGDLPEDTDVVMGGMVEKIRRRSTRNKDPMAVLKVLDTRNTFEAVLFPRAYEEYRERVEEGSILFFGGRIKHGNGTSLIVEEIMEVDEAQRLARWALIRVDCEEAGEELWSGLRDILARHGGTAPVYVDITSDRYLIRCQTGNGHKARPTSAFADEVEALLGPHSVTLGVHYTAPEDERRKRVRKYANSRN